MSIGHDGVSLDKDNNLVLAFSLRFFSNRTGGWGEGGRGVVLHVQK